MTASSAHAAWRPLLLPGIRLGRLLWRLLPHAGAALVLWAIARILQAGPRLLDLVDIAVVALLVYGGARSLIRELLAPERPSLRLIPLPDRSARLLAAGLGFFLAVLVAAEAGRHIVLAAPWNPSVAAGLAVMRNVAILGCGMVVILSTGLIRWLRARSGESFWGLIGKFTGRLLVPLVFLALLFLVVVQGLGYVPLARFVSRNLVVTGLRLIAAVVAFHYLRKGVVNVLRHFQEEEDPDAEPGSAGTGEANPAVLGTERIALAALRLVAILATTLWVLDAWNLSAATGMRALGSPIFGGAGMTWAQLLGGILEVVVVLAAGWLVRMILTYFVFPRTTMEIGARYAIHAVLRYLVIVLAFVFALDAIGLDTSSLGWFFGAAGVGLGLGLQDVIGNFFSGLVMLVERPIRVGDTVQVGDAVGKVEDIRMRGTVIRTFDNTSITIPNRQMLNDRVTNLSYGMRHARVKLELGVDYATNPLRVKEILLEEARGHPDVLLDPEPIVWFANFGESSIDFTLLCYTDKVTGRFTVASELRFRLFDRLGREGVKIPFPQLDIHLDRVT